MSERILVVDDEQLIRWSLNERLTQEGYEIVEAADGASANARVQEEPFDVALLDMRLPDTDGLTLLRRLRTTQPDLPVVVITAYSSIGSAVDAMKAGAFHYLSKPFDLDELVITVGRAVETSTLRRRVSEQIQEQKARFGLDNILAVSPRMRELKDIVRRIALSEAVTVLLLGESGVGKDLIARAIHYESKRADKPLMNITCTALPETLLESELFGHEKGAFTDAKERKKGLFELAHGGTVYMDEIGDVSLATQGKLLRILEDRTFKRIGGTKDIVVDVRVIAATNRDIEQAAEADGARMGFRRDLYYRLSVLPIVVPPLRDRREDIPMLARHFLEQYGRAFHRAFAGIHPGAIEKLTRYDWPGNVRELRNVMERAALLGVQEQIVADDIMLGRVLATPSWEGAQPGAGSFVRLPETGCDLEVVERSLVEQALERTQGNQTRAARLLGISRDQMRYRLEKFSLGH